jgi:hypothetical protein
MLLENIQDLGYLKAVQEHPTCSVQFHRYMLALCFDALDSAAFKQNLANIAKQDSIRVATFEKIPKYFQSASMIWLVHLYRILDSEALEESQNAQVMHLFDTQILYWIKCMALLGKLEDAVDMLKQIEVSLHVRTYISL